MVLRFSHLVAPVLMGVVMALPHALQGQNSLVVHVDGLSEDTVYLAHYYGAKLFYNDTAVADGSWRRQSGGPVSELGGLTVRGGGGRLRDRDLRGEAV